VRIDCPIEKVLRKPELAGRMVAWSIELSEFGIKYESRVNSDLTTESELKSNRLERAQAHIIKR